MKKRLIAILLSAAMVLSLAACGNAKTEETTEDTGKEETEELSSTDIPGFTHILTYYSKLK